MSAFSSSKELCSKLHSNLNSSQDGALQASITAFIHEVISGRIVL